MRLSPALSCILFMLALPCTAQTTPAPDDVVKESMSIYWDDPQYPAISKERSEQGTATIRQDYVNGKPSGDGSIVTSSRSPLLDAAALQALQAVRLKTKGTEAEPETVKLLVDVEFGRDTVTKLDKKPCAEFSADVAYYQSSQPGAALSKMRLYEMTLGMVALSGKLSNLEWIKKVTKAMPIAYGVAATECQKAPDAKYLEVFSKAFKAAL